MIIYELILLRFHQIGRFIRATGVILLVALLVSVGFIFQVIEQVRSLDSIYLAGLGLLIVAGVHFSRKDLRFLAKITRGSRQLRLILLADYLLLLSPLIFLLLGTSSGESGLMSGLGAFAGSLLPIRTIPAGERKRKKNLRWIPVSLFEVKCHIERHKLGYAAFYTLSLLSPLHIGFFLVGFFFLSTLLLTAYGFYEPKEILRWEEHFLRKKIWRNGWFLARALLPAIALAAVFQFGQWPLLLYASAIPFLTGIFGLLHKYARLTPLFYQPPNSNIPGIFLILLLLPGGVLIHIGYTLILLRKARKNLRYYYA